MFAQQIEAAFVHPGRVSKFNGMLVARRQFLQESLEPRKILVVHPEGRRQLPEDRSRTICEWHEPTEILSESRTGVPQPPDMREVTAAFDGEHKTFRST